MATLTGYRHDMSELTRSFVEITDRDAFSGKYVDTTCNVQDEVWVKKYCVASADDGNVYFDVIMVDKSWLRLDDTIRRIDYQESSYRDTCTIEKKSWSERVYRFNQEGSRFANAVSADLVRDLANEMFDCDYRTLKQNAYQVSEDLCKNLGHRYGQTMVLFSLPGEPVDVLIEPIGYGTNQLITD